MSIDTDLQSAVTTKGKLRKEKGEEGLKLGEGGKEKGDKKGEV